MTNNGAVNLVMACQAAEEFRPPRVLAVFPRDPQISTGTGVTSEPKIQQAFAPHTMLRTWNEYISDGAVKLGETVLRESDVEAQQTYLRSLITGGTLLPLLLERQGCLQIMPAEAVLQTDDRLIYLLHDPKPKLLKLLSGSSQPRLILETLPEVENIPVTASSNIATEIAPQQETSATAIVMPPNALTPDAPLAEAVMERIKPE
jgi:hypothetical protein